MGGFQTASTIANRHDMAGAIGLAKTSKLILSHVMEIFHTIISIDKMRFSSV